MKCLICHDSGRPMYCAHCMSSSPNLLLTLKIDLLMLRETNVHLKSRVEDILEYGLSRIAEEGGDEPVPNVEGDILGKRLRKLDSLVLRKKNNKIRYRISQLRQRIDQKTHKITMLNAEVRKQCFMNSSKREAVLKKNHNDQAGVEVKQQLLQIKKVLLKSQLVKIRSLVDWFVIRKRDSYEFPYTLSFQPVVSLKNVYKLPPSVVWGSIMTMFRYLTLFSELLFFTLPHKEPAIPNIVNMELETSIKTPDESTSDDAGIMDHLTKLLINIVQVSRHLNLISQEPIDLAWMLDQNDLDTLFYNMAMRLETKSKPVSHHWTYPQILAVVSDALQLSSVYATSPTSRRTLTGTLANNNDHWFVVR
ncbi:related to Autophagy-related protein 14 [Zygosaccharomyces bailii]|nr:related to Autophagy-related protein 14 [Zygosaccharomyces bailii]